MAAAEATVVAHEQRMGAEGSVCRFMYICTCGKEKESEEEKEEERRRRRRRGLARAHAYVRVFNAYPLSRALEPLTREPILNRLCVGS